MNLLFGKSEAFQDIVKHGSPFSLAKRGSLRPLLCGTILTLPLRGGYERVIAVVSVGARSAREATILMAAFDHARSLYDKFSL